MTGALTPRYILITRHGGFSDHLGGGKGELK